jgi:hypothetical protein
MPARKKLLISRRWLQRVGEDRLDYELGMRALQENGPTYSLEEVVRRLGIDKYHLKFRTLRLQKKHRWEPDAAQK